MSSPRRSWEPMGFSKPHDERPSHLPPGPAQRAQPRSRRRHCRPAPSPVRRRAPRCPLAARRARSALIGQPEGRAGRAAPLRVRCEAAPSVAVVRGWELRERAHALRQVRAARGPALCSRGFAQGSCHGRYPAGAVGVWAQRQLELCGAGVAGGRAGRQVTRCLAWGERELHDAGLGSAARSDRSALSCFPFLK